MICLSVVQQGLPTLLLGFLQAPHYYSFILEAVSAKWWWQYSRCICLVVLLRAILCNITVTALIFIHLDSIWKQLNFFTAQEKTSRPFAGLFRYSCNHGDVLKVRINFKHVPFSNKPKRKTLSRQAFARGSKCGFNLRNKTTGMT